MNHLKLSLKYIKAIFRGSKYSRSELILIPGIGPTAIKSKKIIYQEGIWAYELDNLNLWMTESVLDLYVAGSADAPVFPKKLGNVYSLDHARQVRQNSVPPLPHTKK